MRRDWLRGFLARKSPPRNAIVHIATTLGRAGHDLRRAMESGHPTACELLGLEPVGSVYTGRTNPIAEAAQTAGTARATQLALAVLLGAAEDATSRQTWRSPTAEHQAYFTALRDWGYPLAPVEQLVLADATDQPTTRSDMPDEPAGPVISDVADDGPPDTGAPVIDSAEEDNVAEVPTD